MAYKPSSRSYKDFPQTPAITHIYIPIGNLRIIRLTLIFINNLELKRQYSGDDIAKLVKSTLPHFVLQ